MKTHIKNRLPIPVLIAGLGLMLASGVTAQTFTTLHSFNGGSDGADPVSGLILSGDTLYGTTADGGSSGKGAVFAVNSDGTGFTTLYNFTGGSDGANPRAGLILSGNTLYGTASQGGSGAGTVFAINTDGTGFTILHSFTAASPPFYINGDGAQPYAGLILSGNTLYGAASQGGSSGYGTVFAVNTNGTDFTPLHSFTGVGEGAGPQARLILSGNTLYGTTTFYGGPSGCGTVFAVNTDGTGFTILHSFFFFEGANAEGDLVLSGNTLYGTASQGGSFSAGTVFAINTDGGGFTTLHNFGGGSEGAVPGAGLILSGNTLYGTAQAGGSSGFGTVFNGNIDGSGFTALHNFTVGADGGYPRAGLILSGNTLYGTATAGGSLDNGTVFKLALAQLQFTGFLAPISGADATGGSFATPVRTFKAGSTIPVKFSATSEGAPVTTGVHSLQAIKFSDATTGGVPIDATPQDAATPGNQFRLTGQNWQFNLDTRSTGITTGIWQLVATLSDGSQHTVWVQIK